MRRPMGPRDRDDLVRLVTRIQAIEQADRAKAGVARELREKLQRCLSNGWLPEPAIIPAAGRRAGAANAAPAIS